MTPRYRVRRQSAAATALWLKAMWQTLRVFRAQPKRRHSRRTPRSSVTPAFLGSAPFRRIGS